MTQLKVTNADVVVIGAGITGLASAFEAAKRGASVVVIEKEPGPGCEASGRAQGSLRLQGRHKAEFELINAAMEMWRDLDEEADIELRFGGNAYLTDREDEVENLRKLVRDSHERGLTSVELLDAHEARKVIPAARGEFLAAMVSPVDGQVQPDKATRRYAELAKQAGAAICYETTALKITEKGGQIAGVETDRGNIETTDVIAAAGVWTSYIAATVGVQIPVMPISMSAGETRPMDPLFSQTIRATGFSARQRPGGRVVVDAGMDSKVRHGLSLYDTRFLRLWVPRLGSHIKTVNVHVDFKRILQEIRYLSRTDTRTVRTGTASLPADRPQLEKALTSMSKVFPDMENASLARDWVGFIDMSPDGLPIIDNGAGPGGLTIVTGLSGHGFALGPVTGKICSQLALDGRSQFDLHPFRLARFREERVSIPTKMT